MRKMLDLGTPLKLVLGLLLTLLTWEANRLVTRLDRVERNLQRVMVHLQIEPVAVLDPQKWGLSGTLEAAEINQSNPGTSDGTKKSEFFP